MITIAYLTNRREPMVHWFFDSFHRECAGDYTDFKIVVIDFYADYPGRREEILSRAKCPITHIPPKPSVWQGQHRLTTVDYFDAANARNTALCVAPDGYIVYVDDLSVLLPGWLDAVRASVQGGYIAAGTYEKVLGLEVDASGNVVGYRTHPPGRDTRLNVSFGSEPVKCGGGWLFGASFAAPVEAMLAINGQNELHCSAMGSEDYICGLMLEKSGYELKFCPRMKTLESEERHHDGSAFKRIIKAGNPDSSWVALNKVLSGECQRSPNIYEMRDLRRLVLFENQPFPIPTAPKYYWFDNTPLAEM